MRLRQGDRGRTQPRADLCRRRRQSRRRRARQYDVDPSRRSIAAGVRDALVGRDPRSRRSPPRRMRRARAPASRRGSTATAATSSPNRSALAAIVRRLHDGTVRGRRGIYANNTLDLGPSAALQHRRHHRRGDLQPRAMRRSGVLRGVRPGHRRRTGRGGEVARPFPRRLRRVLPPRAGDRGGCAGPDQPDPVALSPGSTCRGRCCRSTTRHADARTSA